MLAPTESDHLIVVLVRPRNPLNIGAVARAMSNFGFQHLRVVNPFAEGFREARSAVGASGVLARAEQYEDVAAAVADCTLVVGTTAGRNRQLQHTLHSLNDRGAMLIRRRLRSGRVALLFGSEKTGLSNPDFDHCHWLLRIPTRARHVSMNLGQAAAVCFYELARTKPGKIKGEAVTKAHANEIERITRTLFVALQASGYVKPGSEASAEGKIRRMVLRLNLQAVDAELWLGMLRQILWKLKQQDGEG